jgi:hypothetical protein
MYDSINLWLSNEQAGIKDLLAFSEKHLQNITVHNKQDGQIIYSGLLRNYKVNVSLSGISLKGSLAKYFLPDNFHTLNRGDSQRAIEMMADDLHLPIDKAKVGRIDFAQNFLMRYEPKAYYSYLGDCQHYKRFAQPESVYYNNGLRTKLFYNKVAEGKAKGLSLPDVWNGQNVLRYELRFTSRLPQQFNIQEVTAKTLYDEQFYISLVRNWIDEYKAINKLNLINFNLTNMNSPKDFRKQLELIAVNAIGQETIMQMIEEMRIKRSFDKPEYYSRLKKDLRELCKTPELTTSSDMVAELDKKIEAVRQHYR